MPEPEILPPERDEKGRLLPGHTANPSGENGLRGWARWEKRVEYFMDSLTVDQIRTIVTTEANQKNYTVRDWQILIHLARTVTGKDIRGEREALYDRLWGYPTQKVLELPADRPTQKEVDDMTDEEAQREYERLTKG